MKLDEEKDFMVDPCVLHPSKRKAQAFWPEVKEETNDRMVINIGGRCFETSRQTLCVDSNSMLTAWVTRHHPNNNTLWIDRDANRFAHVLNYLRNGTVWLNDISLLRGIQEEADFFALGGLHKLCDDLIQELEAKEEDRSRRKFLQIRDALRDAMYNLDSSPLPIDQVVAASTDRLIRPTEPVFQTDADF